jgi:hypothetical protein
MDQAEGFRPPEAVGIDGIDPGPSPHRTFIVGPGEGDMGRAIPG